MPLKLTIASYQRLSPGQEAFKTLDRGSLSIGRAAKNDWVLQDPERILSSVHCIVHYEGGGYALTDNSTNGTFLNDANERIPRNTAAPLKNGDHFSLGEYEISVALTGIETAARDDEDDGPITHIAPEAGLPPQIAAAIPNLIAPQLQTPADLARPSFDELLTDSHDHDEASQRGDSLGLHGADIRLARPGVATEPPVNVGGPEGAIYEPPDLLAPEPPAAMPVLSAAPEPALGLPKPMPANVPSLIPDNWWELPAVPSTPISAPPAIPSAAVAVTTPAPLVTPPPLIPPPVIPAPLAPSPLPAAPAPTPVPAATTPTATSTELTGQELLLAFLVAAGLLELRVSDAQSIEAMTNLGAMFRETVQGLMDILLARSDVKGEFRLERTSIGPTKNNPLKTPPGQPPLPLEHIMTVLLMSQSSAYMPSVQAVREGFTDIKAHQLAVMAGIQAALARLLERFDPSNLATRLEQSVLDNIWPGNRKAKYWDLFNDEYRAIAHEAEDDFNELFGKEFARAYEQRLRSR